MKWISIVLILACAVAVAAQACARGDHGRGRCRSQLRAEGPGGRFTKSTGTQVTLSFGASGNLFSQIQNGAPFDLFFSADADYPKKLGRSRHGGCFFATHLRCRTSGAVGAESSPLDPQKLKMDLLTEPEVQRIAIANPQHAPYGRAAMAALEHFGLKDKVAAKLVYGREHQPGGAVRAVGQRAGGLIALSLALSPAMKDAGQYWELPADSYPEMWQVVGDRERLEAQGRQRRLFSIT